MEVGEKHVIYSSPYKHMMMMIMMMIKMIVTNHRLSSSMMMMMMMVMVMMIDGDICCVGAVGESGEPAWNIAYECRNKVRSGCMTFQLHAIVGCMMISSIYLHIYNIYSYIHLSIHISIYSSIYLFIYPFIHLSIRASGISY